jgi:uncharacterized protein YndB with AHSA1/START domain
MTTRIEAKPHSDLELVIARLIDAPRASLFRAWTEPELMKQWFAPRPWTLSKVETDLRPGGSSTVVMRDPEGNEYPSNGVYLDVVSNERLVFTDAFTRAWVPSARPFFVAIVTFEDAGGGKTKYTARALHWTKEARDEHEKMGFHDGWAQCAEQLEEVAKKL